MKSNYNSLTAKLYRWFFCTNDMPENLCPYFWKCVLMYVLIIPYSILSLPEILCEIIFKEAGMEASYLRPLFGLLAYILIFVVGCMLFTIITIWSADSAQLKQYNPFYVMGIMFWLTAIVYGIIQGI